MTIAFVQIIVTPAGLHDPSLAIAASRAGALGLLDLEYALDESVACEAATLLARYGQGRYGLKLHCRQGALLTRLLACESARWHTVVLTGADPALLGPQVAALHAYGAQVLFEVTSLDDGQLGVALHMDGLIAKGNEAGGRVAEETTFILLQACLSHFALLIYAQGGIGLHTAAACAVAGAAGVLLDAQLWLARESPLPTALTERIAAMDGSETVCLGAALGRSYRVYAAPGEAGVELLRREEARLVALGPSDSASAEWEQIVWRSHATDAVTLVGQDAAFAASLAQRFVTVAGIVAAIHESVVRHSRVAAQLRSLDEGAPLAISHGTRYPIVQGPMTRVSDTAAFAEAVARAGAIPFLALALMRGPEMRDLLDATRRQLGTRPWGVGILGFVPPAVRQEQIDAIRTSGARFAIIAGGRPDQAASLDQAGIPTYLHVPSPRLLSLFLADGARRFIFEGRECGGHVGPRSSFVLWEAMIELLLDHVVTGKMRADDVHLLFAGGIHDARSAAMVATLAASLAALGVKIGVLMGTAYLFTQEAVASGAIVAPFQEAVLSAERTVLLESGPGHVTRCLPSTFTQTFSQHKQQLIEAQAGNEQLRDALEALNLGRLRVASKGIIRNEQSGDSPSYLSLDAEQQQAAGLYMIGQVAALRQQRTTMDALHHDVAVGSADLLAARADALEDVQPTAPAAQPARIAIVGMATLLPGARQLESYWENILNSVDSITEVPAERWDWRRFFDADKTVRDKIYSRWGGFIDEIVFHPLDYGLPPNAVKSIEPLQLLMLDTVRAGLADAGYLHRPFPRERTSVIVAAGGGQGDLGYLYGFRSYLPTFIDDVESSEVIERIKQRLPEWTEDSFPGILLNVVAGRVANRFDLGGPNFTVDAACGSSLAALDIAVNDLAAQRTDMAIVGAGDTVQSPFGFLAFSKTQALSPTGRCRPFDAQADGIAISEGLAVVVLKRLADAERDGDRIYAVIDGVGSSSDGKDKGLTAPRPIGQMRALQRAYTRTGYAPATVGLIEAHGTGTRLGDQVELESLGTFFRDRQAGEHHCALGSVKSMIGHTKSTAGLAGLIKVAKALYHTILPPTLVDQPNPQLLAADHPLYLNTAARPWFVGASAHGRRAGVSAFGFGGTNFHVALEEYRNSYLPPSASRTVLSAELLLWRAPDVSALAREVMRLGDWLAADNAPPLRDLAFSAYQRSRQAQGSAVLAIVATSLDDLRGKIALAHTQLNQAVMNINDAQGIFFNAQPLAPAGKVAFLFPGQGSQRVDMLGELAMQFPSVRQCFERANANLAGLLPHPLTDYLFPPPTFSEAELQAQQAALTATHRAQPALGAAGLAMSTLLGSFGVRPALVAGHSYGEIVALWQAGVISERDLFAISEARGRFMTEIVGPDAGTMAAVRADRTRVVELVAAIDGVTLANMNAPNQTTISGPRAAIEQAVQHLKRHDVAAQLLSVACAFHSPLVSAASARFGTFLDTIAFGAPTLEIFSNTTAERYPPMPADARTLLAQQLARPVEFQRQIEAMYAAGARIFIEAGPGGVLTGLVGRILEGQPHSAVACDRAGVSAALTLCKALGQLAANDITLELEPLFAGRSAVLIDIHKPYQLADQAQPGPTTWLINGGRARLWQDAQLAEAALPPAPLKMTLGDQPQHTLATPTATNGSYPTNGHSSAPVPQLANTAPIEAVQSASDHEATEVMLQYQRLMGQFLQTQAELMQTFLAGTTTAQPISNGHQHGASEQLSNDAATPAPGMTVPVKIVETVSDDQPAIAQNGEQPVQLDAEALAAALIGLVSERTGYPAELLDLHADLEADLGIDSIKRVEILGSFCRSQPSLEGLLTGQEMDRLASQRSLGAMLDWLASYLATSDQSVLEPFAPIESNVERQHNDAPIGRFVLAPVAASIIDLATPIPAGRLFVITDDGAGIASALAERLQHAGYRVVLVGAEIGDAAAVHTLVSDLRTQHGAISGLIHLAPLVERRAESIEEWRAERQRTVTSLFAFIHELHSDLVAQAQIGGACLLAATTRGGCLDTTSAQLGGALHNGIAGLLKTAAHELPQVRVRTVDVDPHEAMSVIIELLIDELAVDDGLIEVGYRAGQRVARQMMRLPLPAPVEGARLLENDSVVLITGGARGIAAQVALDLAARYRPTLVLAGRSLFPSAEERPETAGRLRAADIKQALIATWRRAGVPIILSEVETAYQRLLQEREIRATIAALHQAGANVRYEQVDVRDAGAFSALIDRIYDSYGRLDGVLHGAGIIDDKLIADKTPASFERVVSTKIDSAFVLAHKLRPETLRFLAFFASVSGRFGNAGQSDYAAANEVLNGIASTLDRRWPARVVAINWGPWEAGMVSPELQRSFAQRGVSLISVATGCERLHDELLFGRKGESEVLICSADAAAMSSQLLSLEVSHR